MVEAELAFELARLVVSDLEPAELEVLDALGADFVAASRSSGRGDGALGFDAGQVSVAVASAWVAGAVVDYIGKVAVELATDEGKGVLQKLLKRLRERRDPSGSTAAASPTVPEIAPAHLAHIRTVAFEQARSMGLNEARAELLANAMIGGLSGPQPAAS